MLTNYIKLWQQALVLSIFPSAGDRVLHLSHLPGRELPMNASFIPLC
jgi:hypothetical protein